MLADCIVDSLIAMWFMILFMKIEGRKQNVPFLLALTFSLIFSAFPLIYNIRTHHSDPYLSLPFALVTSLITWAILNRRREAA